MSKKELGKLIISSEDSMYRVARSLLKSDEDCADAIQDTIVSAFTNIHKIKSNQYAKTWMIRILINKCYDLLRRKKKEFTEVSIKTHVNQPENADYSELYEILDMLPDEMRITITLYYMEDYSVKEIARMLSVSESAIKSRMSRGREQLKKLFQKKGIHNYYQALEL